MAGSSRVEDSNPTNPRQGVVPASSSPPPSPPPRGHQSSVQRTTDNDDDAAPTSTGGDTSKPSTADDDEGRASKASVCGKAGLRDSNAFVWADWPRKNKWELFVGGNLISAAVIVSEISQVNGCFDEPREEMSDATDGRAGNTAESEIGTGESMRVMVIALLVFGLVTELISAVVLSSQYRSPLDIKSMRKVPPDTIRSCGGASVVVNFLAPFSWGVIYTCGSYVTIQVDTFASCGGHEESGLVMYLVVSGLFMFLVGLSLLALAVFMLVFSCGSPTRCTDNCCAAVRRAYSRRILSIAALLDVFWQVQGSVWLYRTGGVDGSVFVVLVVFCIVGGVLAALGSGAPDSAQELPGDAPPPVLTEQTEAADGV